MSIPPKVRYTSPRHASYLYYGPVENGTKMTKSGCLRRISACIGRFPTKYYCVCSPIDTARPIVIFHRFRNAAEGGMLEAFLTGRNVVKSTTTQAKRNSPAVLPHGNSNAAPSPSHIAL